MKKVILTLSAVVLAFVLFTTQVKPAHTSESGAPNGSAGAPNDMGGATCAQSNCHPGSATTVSNLITSTIPITGYVPGQVYTITARIADTDSVAQKFGFQLTAQNGSNTALGTIQVTNTVKTKTSSAGKYITHKGLAGTANGGLHNNVWQFDWTAPAAGTGDVTFYGAFNVSNNNSSTSGDEIYKSTLTVTENLTGIDEDKAALAGITIYPNPGNGNFNLAFNNINTEVETNIFSAEGKLVHSQTHQRPGAGKQNIQLNLNGKLNAGVYFVSVKAGDASKVLKFIVQ